MGYRNMTYVAFDGDNDMAYYRLMQAWKQNDGINFSFYNAHDLNTARDTSQEESIKRQLKERLNNTKLFVLLIGDKTRYLFKFVRWEIEQAILMDLPIVAVNLNGRRSQDADLCPPILREELAIHVSFNAKIMQHALENWEENHRNLRREGKSGPYYYNESVYKDLGL